MQSRRITDKNIEAMELTLKDHIERDEEGHRAMMAEIKEIKETVKAMSDIVTAWNNARGFVQTIQTIAKVLAVISLIASPFVAFGYFIKTGTWK